MQMLDNLQWAVLLLFVLASMAGIGLRVRLREFGAMLQRKSLLLRCLLVNFLAVPALGWLAARFIPMSSSSADAIFILTCVPGGVTAIQFTSKRTEVLAFAGQTAFLLTGLSIFVSPFLIALFLPPDMPLVVPYEKGFGYVVLTLLLPMGIGVFLRERAERLAERLAKPIALIGSVSFVAFVVVTLSARQEAMGTLDGRDVVTMLGVIIATMIVGWLGGGPEREMREVLASATCMRNVALGLTVVTRNFPHAGLEVPLVAYSALMVPPNVIFLVATMILKRRKRA